MNARTYLVELIQQERKNSISQPRNQETKSQRMRLHIYLNGSGISTQTKSSKKYRCLDISIFFSNQYKNIFTVNDCTQFIAVFLKTKLTHTHIQTFSVFSSSFSFSFSFSSVFSEDKTTMVSFLTICLASTISRLCSSMMALSPGRS